MGQCKKCKAEPDIENGESFVEVRGEDLCVDCFISHYRHEVCCNNCQQPYSDNDDYVEVNGVVYCITCAIAEFEIQE